MNESKVDKLLSEVGAQLFEGRGNLSRASRGKDPLSLGFGIDHAQRANAVRAKIAKLTSPAAVQVMVKVTGGGRGLGLIAAHLRYISKAGRLEMENDRGDIVRGKEGLIGLVQEWRRGGASYLPERSSRREALHIIFSMPRGTSAQALRESVRTLAVKEFDGHTFAMVFHDHQSQPHIHLAVRVESYSGVRLNPRKGDLARWRFDFARELQSRGIEAVATLQPTHGTSKVWPRRVQSVPREQGGAQREKTRLRSSAAALATRAMAARAWDEALRALGGSVRTSDRDLASSLRAWLERSRGIPVDRSPGRARNSMPASGVRAEREA